MESEVQQTPSPVAFESPPRERLQRPELWQVDTFYEQLSAPQAFAYEHLPNEIQLDDHWHRLVEQLVQKTAQDGKEWSADVAFLDRAGRLLSLPFSVEPYFGQWWGPDQRPVFISHLSQGSDSFAKQSPIPSVIEWHSETIALKRVGLLHTHPNQMPFSDGDINWLVETGTYAKQEKFIAAATKTATYFLLRTDATPAHASPYLQKGQERHNWHQWFDTQFQPQRAILTRNQHLAQACKLGLYSSRPGEPLSRLA